MRVIVAGASGLVGSALVPMLRARGHAVSVLVRHAPTSDLEIEWHPETGSPPSGGLGTVDGIVNLSGASIASGRWTVARRKELYSSRVDTTAVLVDAIAEARPAVLVNASAVGYYGDREDEVLTEASPSGRGFLPNLCVDWERKAYGASPFGVRVVCLRTGMVISGAGGALPRLATLTRRGLGCQFGDGRSWMAWISCVDLIHLIALCLENEKVHGAVNAVAPRPATQGDFAGIIAAAVGRGQPVRLPPWVAKLALGEMAEAVLLPSQRVFPAVLQSLGFEYQLPRLPDAVAESLAVS